MVLDVRRYSNPQLLVSSDIWYQKILKAQVLVSEVKKLDQCILS